jgi:hypothetical protein
MMELVLIWNLACYTVLAGVLSIRESFSGMPKGRALESWLLEARQHEMHLPGYTDPLFDTPNLKLPETQKNGAST